MYRPAEDTYFMEDVLSNYRGKNALEVGIGSGYLTRILCSNFEFVVGTDIDFNSVIYAKNNALTKFSNILLVCTDLSLPLKCKFDLIICNPPYLPTDVDNFDDTTIYGGKNGIEMTIRLLRSIQLQLSEIGKIVIMRSTLSDYLKMDEFIDKLFLNNKIIGKKTFFFESLEIIELSGVKNSSHRSDYYKKKRNDAQL
ncbi:HemK2/MTQ2 family protein methyltransferase [Candidatus Nitrosocosmicus sp. T]